MNFFEIEVANALKARKENYIMIKNFGILNCTMDDKLGN
jgi:hypothetical protein